MESTKNADIRVNNRKRMVNTLFRKGAMTKQELASELDLSLPTVTLLLKELKDKGLIANGETVDSTGGRKPVLLEPVYNVKYSVGLEASMHELRIVAIDLATRVVAKETWPYGLKPTREYWEKVSRLVDDFIETHIQEPDKVLDIGLTMQLRMNRSGLVWRSHVPPELRFELPMVESCFSRTVNIRNSAKMAALAHVWGANLEENFVYVAAGAFFDGAIVSHGRVRGFEEANAQFGRMVFRVDGECRRFEDCCTIGALCGKSGTSNVHEFYERLEGREAQCVRVWEEALDLFSACFYNAHQILGWQVVVGGALSPCFALYETELEERMCRLEDDSEDYRPYVVISDLGAHSAAIGAAMLSADRFLEFGYNDL